MPKYSLVALFLFISQITVAQNSDSLLQYAIKALPNNVDSSYQIFLRSLKEASDSDKKLELYASYGKELYYKSELNLLLELANQGIKLPITDSSYTSYSDVVKHKFDVFNLRKDYDSALVILGQMNELATSYGDSNRLVTVLVEKANIYEFAGDYGQALDANFSALELALALGDPLVIANAQINVAIFYQKIDKPRLSIQYNKNALEIYQELGNNVKMAQIYNNVGLVYDDLGYNSDDIVMFDSAEYFFKKSYAISEEMGNDFGKAVTRLNLGLNAYRRKEYDKAIDIFDEVFVYFENVSDDFGLSLCYLNYCRIFEKQGKIDKAIDVGLKGLAIAKDKNFMNERLELAEHLSLLYELKNNSSKAFFYYKDYIAAKDSLTNREQDREIGRLESKHELDLTIFENQLKEKENEILREEAIISQQQLRTKNILIVGSSIIVGLLALIAFLTRRQLNERKKLLIQIEKQAEKLRELDIAKSRFFANISHDLRSPLTLILGALDKITEKDFEVLDKDSRTYLEAGYKNGKRLLYLADEIMDLTRLEEGKIKLELQYVKIVPYLRLLTKMFSSAADIKSIELKYTSKAEDETIIQLDPHQFEKIIYNLLSNAIKFTPDGGKVDVHVKTLDEQVEINISDSGSGIPEESLGYIFDRYYQSGSNEFEAQAGVGIGLALVKELIELHKGTITVQSSEVGTSFSILLPFKESDWVSKAVIPERSLDVVTRNSLWVDLQEEKENLQIPSLTNDQEDAKSILIVEDHKELRSYLRSILSSDFRVYMATNGASALDILQSDKIDLIVTDLMMPYMDGFELIDHLKKDKELKKLPVLVVSARTDKSEKLALIAKGAEEVISKPFDKEELIARIHNILGRDWDSNQKLGKLYSETAEEFEKNVMARLERLILKRIDDPHLSVLDLADEMAASERKVYRLIKKISGLTPYELIKEVRWQYLEKYLSEHKIRTATEAAQQIGMNNVSSFSQQYRKRFGHSIKEQID